MSGQSSSGRCVNVVPVPKIKRELPDDVEDTVMCKICTKGFAYQTALNNHVKMEHFDEYCTGDPTVWTKPAEPKPRKITQIWMKSDISQMTPTSVTSLASNDVSYIILKDDIKSETTVKKKPRATREAKVVPEEVIAGPFECLQPSTAVADGTCHQIFFSCCEYSIHYRDEHTKRRRGLKCQVCEKPLACIGTDPKMPFACEECPEGFETTKDLADHVSTVHVKLKPYECHVCHKRFTQLGGVLQHMRMHTGDRPYPCSFCSKSFTQKSGLDQHLRIHTKVRPYRCVVCSKTFSQSVHVKQHMRTHTQVAPFQCGFCDKRFKQSSHLNYHLKNHNPANMTEDQKAKYSELIGLISKDFVEIEIEQSEEYPEHMEGVKEEVESPEGELVEGGVIVEDQEQWTVSIAE